MYVSPPPPPPSPMFLKSEGLEASLDPPPPEGPHECVIEGASRQHTITPSTAEGRLPRPPPPPGMHWKGGTPPPPSGAPSLCPATVSLTAGARGKSFPMGESGTAALPCALGRPSGALLAPAMLHTTLSQGGEVKAVEFGERGSEQG